MLKPLALGVLLGSCVAPTASAPATVSLSGCQLDGAPVVAWYVVGRGHEVWLHSGSAPMMVATASTTKAQRGTLPAAWNADGRTVTVEVRIDGGAELRTVWATKPCP